MTIRAEKVILWRDREKRGLSNTHYMKAVGRNLGEEGDQHNEEGAWRAGLGRRTKKNNVVMKMPP